MEIKKIICNLCNNFTNHQLLFSYNSEESEWDSDENNNIFPLYTIYCTHNLWSCMGCNQVTYEIIYKGNIDDMTTITEYWPARKIHSRLQKNFSSIPRNIAQTYKEVISCVNENNNMLAAIGIRAILEAICENIGISNWGLSKKLKELKKREIFNENIIDALENFKFLGDKSAHELHIPNSNEISSALNVLEDLLMQQYEANYKLEESATRFKYLAIKKDKNNKKPL